MDEQFKPKLFTLLKSGITKQQIIKDILAGIIVGIVALPLAIAFSIASGVSPEKGLITAIIAGFMISVFGGSRVQIGGPTGAFIIIVFGIVQQFGIEGLTIATFLAGFILILMGLLKLGRMLKYFPYTLIVGFTSGIAVVIFSTQIKDFLGLKIDEVPTEFIDKWICYFSNLSSINYYALAIGLISIILTIFIPKIFKKIPGTLVAIIVCTLASELLHLPIDTITSKFGAIPNSFPKLQFISIDFSTIHQLLQPALAIAILGAIESLLSAVVADGMIGGKHRPNAELIAQGGANIFSALFGGIPATGAIARTATNIKNGGRTPISGITHSITLLLIMLIAAPLAGKIPLACLAGILIVVAYNMSEVHNFVSIFKGTKSDISVLLATFLITVIFDLIIAIEVGMVLAAFLFMRRMSEMTGFNEVLETNEAINSADVLLEDELKDIPADILVYEISGPLFFGAAQKFQDILHRMNDKHEIIVLRMRYVSMIDATALNRLKEIIHSIEHENKKVLISGVKENIKSQIIRENMIANNQIFTTVKEAMNSVRVK